MCATNVVLVDNRRLERVTDLCSSYSLWLGIRGRYFVTRDCNSNCREDFWLLMANMVILFITLDNIVFCPFCIIRAMNFEMHVEVFH